jgi:hypothetical protein
MVNVVDCDGCVHFDVCSKKELYHKFIEAMNRACVSPKDHSILYAKDWTDVLVDVKCNHYVHFPMT